VNDKNYDTAAQHHFERIVYDELSRTRGQVVVDELVG